MKYRHYAPTAPLELLDGDVFSAIEYVRRDGIENIAIICYDEDLKLFSEQFSSARCYSFGNRGDEESQAHILFSILRDADKEKFDKIYAPLPSTDGVGLALYNRMIRAAAHKIVRL
jgi:L-threonylcarbamoyladenylate synthase